MRILPFENFTLWHSPRTRVLILPIGTAWVSKENLEFLLETI